MTQTPLQPETTPRDVIPLDYVVITYAGGRRKVAQFGSIEFARKHADMCQPGFVYRADQCHDLEQGYLFPRDKQPIYQNTLQVAS